MRHVFCLLTLCLIVAAANATDPKKQLQGYPDGEFRGSEVSTKPEQLKIMPRVVHQRLGILASEAMLYLQGCSPSPLSWAAVLLLEDTHDERIRVIPRPLFEKDIRFGPPLPPKVHVTPEKIADQGGAVGGATDNRLERPLPSLAELVHQLHKENERLQKDLTRTRLELLSAHVENERLKKDVQHLEEHSERESAFADRMQWLALATFLIPLFALAGVILYVRKVLKPREAARVVT